MRVGPVRGRFVRRSAVAAVELAVILPLLVLFLVGVWEVGRLVEVQQLLTNACREGGRQLSTGVKSQDQAKQDVVNYLKANGITKVATSDVTVANITKASRSNPITADQLDEFRISVSIPFDNVRWIMLDKLTSTQTLSATVDWYSMRDIPITVVVDIPLK